eukprot:1139732-Pelagomonas_calceolata.AAC.6
MGQMLVCSYILQPIGCMPEHVRASTTCIHQQHAHVHACLHAAAADAAAAAEAAHEAAGEGGAAPVAVKDVQLPSTLPSVVEMQVGVPLELYKDMAIEC